MTLDEINTSKDWRPRFFTIWGGQAISLLGSMLVQFALVWYLTSETGSAMALAVATLISMLPQVLIGPLIGALVDRWNRRYTMLIADSVIAVATLTLAGLFLFDVVQLWHIYTMLFIRSVGGLFHWTAMSTSTTLMVPKEHLSRIQGINSMLNGGMNIAAAPLGALLIELLPMQSVLSIDVFTALFAIAPLFFIDVPQPPRRTLTQQAGQAAQTPAPQASIWEDMKAGFQYVLAWPGLMMILGMALLINFLLTPAGTLMPLLVSKHFQGTAIQFATAESLWGIGVILGGLLLGVWGGFKKRVYTSMMGLMVLGSGSLLIGFAPATVFPMAIVGMFILGFSNPVVNGPLMASFQSAIEPEMQGRVFSLISSGAAAMAPIGLLLSAPVVDNLGIQFWYVAGGFVTIAMGIIGCLLPAVIHFENGKPGQQPVLDSALVLEVHPASD